MGTTVQAVAERSFTVVDREPVILIDGDEVLDALEKKLDKLRAQLDSILAAANQLGVRLPSRFALPPPIMSVDTTGNELLKPVLEFATERIALHEAIEKDLRDQVASLTDEVYRERTGRAVSEERIEGLKEQLRQLNAVVEDQEQTIATRGSTILRARPNPDRDLDNPG
jgi:peptidoglycan hydrolase CwlO-like protein